MKIKREDYSEMDNKVIETECFILYDDIINICKVLNEHTTFYYIGKDNKVYPRFYIEM